MLRALSIRDYVIVERLDLELAAGFTALTGETGAGKSILIDALGLLCGARARSVTVVHAVTSMDAGGVGRMPHWKAAGTWKCMRGTLGQPFCIN